MGIYIWVFGFVTLMFLFAEKVKKKQRHIVECFAIFLLCLLAGARARGVGTDTVVYFGPLIDAALSSSSLYEYMQCSWIAEWTIRMTTQYEIGFTLLIYILARLFRSVMVVQFVVQFLIISPVYVVLKRRQDVPLWFGMLIFMLLFYNLSLNAIRQSIAMSLSLLAWQLWIENKRKKSVACVFVGYLFHTSGVIGLGIILLFAFIQAEQKRALRIGVIKIDARYVNMACVIISSITILLASNMIASLLSKTPFYRVVGYISGDVKFMPNQLIKLLPPLLIMIFNFKKVEQNTGQAKFFLSLIILTIIFLQFTSVNTFGGRIADYFMYYGIISYPIMCNKGRNTWVYNSMMVGYLLFYWFFYYGFGNSAETIPYKMINF